MLQLYEFLSKFKEYCQKQFPSETGTAASYTNAVKYLFEFMNVSEVTGDLLLEIKSLEPDIRDSSSILFGELESSFAATGRSSYLKKGFLKAALSVLFEFGNTFVMLDSTDLVLLQEIRDNEVNANFSIETLLHQLPTATYVDHNYSVRKMSGTTSESVKRIRSGRKAEKYFISFLTSLGFVKNLDFFDVANNKAYGYDIRFFDIGLEIKNIKSGYFFLTDNEIARLENTQTHLILIDIDNGIWLLKNNAIWLENSIRDIKELRKYSKEHYSNLDPCDIKLIIDDSLICDVTDIANCSKAQLIKMLQ
ncbi:MAG: hypothetical protein K2J01_03100 [Clostridiales bacterium]|nr:hypothetical protein [Clostridiales bacterium]